MNFTNNLVLILILIFFGLYFVLYENKTHGRKSDKVILSKNAFISLFSLIFYATWYPPAILLVIYYTSICFYFGILLEPKKRVTVLSASISLALIPLFFFKYIGLFFSGGLTGQFEILLPLGLSFYAFSGVGYLVDVYRKQVPAERKFVNVLLFISFWPHLAAGPVLRSKNIFQNSAHKLKVNIGVISVAVLLIGVGLVKKLLIADNIGSYVNWNLSYGVEGMSTIEAWVTMLGFTTQIYADFSGYSDMAIGFALLMGIRLPANFNYPYRATTITDFWRRWHISLSTWFRDYLYFPLGGSKGRFIRTAINILVVFVVSGMWHGVGFGFIVWGAIHGLILIFEKMLGEKYFEIPSVVRWFITMVIVVSAWSFFRLDFSDALIVVSKMFYIGNVNVFGVSSPYYVAVILLMIVYPLSDHVFRFYLVDSSGYPVVNRSKLGLVVLSFLIFLSLLFSGNELPFIYFKF